MTKRTLLKALVGSRAHNLHTETSDYDYRGVHLLPTSEILTLGFKYSGTSWLEGDVLDETTPIIDQTSYELAHFLQLCTKANPSVLEVLLSQDVQLQTPEAEEMRDLLPFMYQPQDAFNAFAGYSKNQQKKLLDVGIDPTRRLKFAVAYVRTSFNLVELFERGTFSLKVENAITRRLLLEVKADQYSDGEIIDIAARNIQRARALLPDVVNKQDLDKVNAFLIRVRKANW